MSRELDAWIAEHVMGLKNVRDNGIGSKFHGPPSSEIGLPAVVPHYSTDIAAAWEVVEKMDHYMVTVWRPNMKIERFQCVLSMDSKVSDAYATTAPMAICLAAKKALEEK